MKPGCPLSSSYVTANGIKGTTISAYGGVGLGYKIGDTIYVNGGNGSYYPTGTLRFIPDNGDGYLKKVAEMVGTDFLECLKKS